MVELHTGIVFAFPPDRIPGLEQETPKEHGAVRISPGGKPEPLKNLGADVWSRRITQEDRLVYRVADEFIDVLQARYHY